jgi:threonine/homoserine efflux transporter RhtA
MTCLLCPSAAVADLLCVPCGAKLWAAQLWEKNPLAFAAGVRIAALPFKNEDTVALERTAALRVITTPREAHGYLASLEAAKEGVR